jgi:hypothetical protein
VSQNVMVVGRGKPYHVPLIEAERLVREGSTVWKKANRRIRYTAGKHARPRVRGLSCYVGAQVAAALRGQDRKTRDVARAFVNDQFHRREPVATA